MVTKRVPGVEWWRDGKRRCSGCQNFYEPVAFAARAHGGQTGDGLDIYCRECRSAANRRSYQRHREQQIADTLAWRKRNRRRYLAYMRRYGREQRTAERLLREEQAG